MKILTIILISIAFVFFYKAFIGDTVFKRFKIKCYNQNGFVINNDFKKICLKNEIIIPIEI